MRRILLLLLSLFMSLSTLPACRKNEQQETTVTLSAIEAIKAGMTKGEVHSLLGASHYDYYSSVYPFAPSWKTDDGLLLTIVFQIDGCEDQNDFLALIEHLQSPPFPLREGAVFCFRFMKLHTFRQDTVFFHV